MGVHILSGEDNQCLFCSTTMFAFGPLFGTDDDVQKFLDWLPIDARRYSDNDLENKQIEWKALSECTVCDQRKEGELKSFTIKAHEHRLGDGEVLKFEDRTENACEECYEVLVEEWAEEPEPEQHIDDKVA